MSEEDHSNNDCLLVAVMSHGSKDGKIQAADYKYPVQELWEKFLGDNCRSLMGKPKIFVIQACEGNMFNNGILFDPMKLEKKQNDDKKESSDVRISNLADLLVMCSTSNKYHEKGGSIFIQAFCEELKKSSQKDLMRILTGVNRKVAFENQSKDKDNAKMESAKQIPNITSLLTKTMYFPRKT